jgi:riboflavin kinase/FMN adenylyltransferase
VVAIGNFDGVHRGHRAVLEAALTEARSKGCPALALTFEPHPRALFQPKSPLFRLTDLETKAALIEAAGMDGVAVADFNESFAALTAEDFVRAVLVDWLEATGVVIGHDFQFGTKRGGDVPLLTRCGAEFGFTTQAIAPLTEGGASVSSSAIRHCLRDGDVAGAALLLGRAYFVTGPVIHGEKRGRDLGYPTANVRLDAGNGLAHGIYAVRFGVDGVWHDGVASFGRRPTFDNGAPLLETFVFDFSGDLYDRMVSIAFIGRIRDELRFTGIEPLIAQMDDDSLQARAILSRDQAS